MEARNIILNIGDNNTNYADVNNQTQNLLREIALLQKENERLKGLLSIAIIQLNIKDKLIRIFNKHG